MKNQYGTLCDYKTGNSIRPATEQEWRESREAEESGIGGGTGVILVDGMSVYVEGGPELELNADVKNHIATVGQDALADMAAGRWDEVMCDALYAACGATTESEMSIVRDIATSLALARLTDEN